MQVQFPVVTLSNGAPFPWLFRKTSQLAKKLWPPNNKSKVGAEKRKKP